MTNFSQAIKIQCELFTPFLEHHIEISSDIFILSKGRIADFVAEIEKNCEQLSKQSQPIYAEFYSQRLIRQFDLLRKQVAKLRQKTSHQRPVFKSNQSFAKNIANLPAYKRREEYQKALRALNDKISWLIEQSYNSTNIEQKHFFEGKIQETEYRKMKCIQAIEECK